MAISSLGIGTGMDLGSLVGQLVAAERAPTETRLVQKEASIQAQISAYGSLKGALSTIESPLKRLSEYEPTMSVSNSNKEALSVTADDDAPAGKFSIEVNQIAKAQAIATHADDASLFSDGSGTEVVAAGASATFSIQVGSSSYQDIELNGGDKGLTLRDLSDAINEADLGVSASIINDGNGARLALTSYETGADNTIKTTATGFNAGMDTALSLDGSVDPAMRKGEVTQEAADAQAKINGIAITSASNTLDDAVDGLSITLLKETESAATVQVSENQSSLEGLLNEFIGGYNELIKQTNTLTAYNAENDAGAVLTGDATVRAVRSMLGSSMVEYGQAVQDNGPVEVDGWDVTTRAGDDIALANLGIVSSKTGSLDFDKAKFREAVEVYGMENIAGAVNDIAGKFHNAVTSFTDSTDGMLAARTKGLRASVDDINEQRVELDERMISLEDRLRAQYTAMDTLVAQMNNTSNYLAGQLANLPGFGGGQ